MAENFIPRPEMPESRPRAVDPQEVGIQLMLLRADNPNIPLHVLADRLNWDALPEIDKGYTLGALTAAQHQSELRARAKTGDRFAISMLNGTGYHEPADE